MIDRTLNTPLKVIITGGVEKVHQVVKEEEIKRCIISATSFFFSFCLALKRRKF